MWTRFVTEAGLREQLGKVLPHAATSNNAYDPCDTALGFIGGILCGADKLAHLAHDPAVAEVLGIEAVSSQSTLSRFFAECGRAACAAISGLHPCGRCVHCPSAPRATRSISTPSPWCTRTATNKACARATRARASNPAIARLWLAVAEVPLIAHFWLRAGNTACVSGAHDFLGDTLARLPAHVRIGLIRADRGFCPRA